MREEKGKVYIDNNVLNKLKNNKHTHTHTYVSINFLPEAKGKKKNQIKCACCSRARLLVSQTRADQYSQKRGKNLKKIVLQTRASTTISDARTPHK